MAVLIQDNPPIYRKRGQAKGHGLAGLLLALPLLVFGVTEAFPLRAHFGRLEVFAGGTGGHYWVDRFLGIGPEVIGRVEVRPGSTYRLYYLRLFGGGHYVVQWDYD